MAQLQDKYKEDLATDIKNYGIVDQTLHFIPMRSYRGRGGWSWNMWIDGRPIMGRADYILFTYHRDF